MINICLIKYILVRLKKDLMLTECQSLLFDGLKNPFTPNVDPRPANAFKNLFSDIEKLKLIIKCVYILLKIEKRKAK